VARLRALNGIHRVQGNARNINFLMHASLYPRSNTCEFQGRRFHMKAQPVWIRALLLCILLPLTPSTFSFAQAESTNDWTATVGSHYIVHLDQRYGFQNNIALNLDVWEPKDNEKPLPTVIYIHGGGWFFGDRVGAFPQLLPYFARGWNVVNVEYRMSGQSLAPAAVEDSVCALRWVYRNAKQFHIDLDRLIVTGHSAGGHLSLMVGLFDPSSGLDNECPADPAWGDVPLKVAAVVNWYGISDVNDLLAGKDRKNYAIAWLGNQENIAAIAKKVSPLTYVRPGLPAIITIHGDSDDVVPYPQAVRLHEGLTRAGVKNELITIPGGKHGFFTDQETVAAYDKVWKFLQTNVPGLNVGIAPAGR
jgi:acetyl esterase/lipase